jgi:MoaA/NifB/PqqE/SkfB family radical SAM enzyme
LQPEEVKDLALCGNERRDVFRKLIQLKLSKAPVGSSLAYLQNGLEWRYDDRITDSKPVRHYQCWAGRAFAHLEADGNLYACSWGSLKQVPGRNVLQEGFRSAWNNLIPLKECRSCSHACGVEHNLLFSLNLSSMFNAFMHLHR